MKFLKIVWPLIVLPLWGQAQSAREIKFQELSIEKIREFTESVGRKTSIARDMNLFEMPEEYQCPLFSDSPYTDVLGAIDKMQVQLNTVFPACENKINNDLLSAKAQELRGKIFEAQKLQELGQTYKLNLTTNSIIQLTQQMQQALSAIAQSQVKVCYKSNQQFRNVIFSMNETFQTLAPVVLDFVKSNPALAQTMGPTLKILAGADNISKGISLIEQIAKDSVIFDMTDKTNRINTIKNVCQFMKLYRRVQYLRLSKLGQVQTVHTEIQNKINVMNQKLAEIKSQSQNNAKDAMLSSAASQELVFSDIKDIYLELSKTLPTDTAKIQKALVDIDFAKEQFNDPLIAQCRVVTSARKNTSVRKTIEYIIDVAQQSNQADAIEQLGEILKSYDDEFVNVEKNKDNKSCLSIGQDWLKVANQILFEGGKLVSLQPTENTKANTKKIAQKEQQIKSEKINFESLKTLINVAAFESAELEKSFKDMHRYLFKGPNFDEVKASCDPKEKHNTCAAGTLTAAYVWYRNDGPIYELLKNDELFFEAELQKVNAAIQEVMRFEQRVTQKEFGGKIPSDQKLFNQYMTKTYELTHLNSKYLAKNSADFVNVCRQSNIALNSYLKATGYLAGSESMCDMIYPALDAETNISQALLGYCQPVSGRASKIQRQIMRLVGRSEAQNLPTDVYQNNFKYSMKSLVDKLIQKYEDLGCEQKSGIN